MHKRFTTARAVTPAALAVAPAAPAQSPPHLYWTNFFRAR
jgi:hypothetical protein